MRIEMPVKVKGIINCLLENGYEAYAVGGCVRDSIMGRDPEDWDITTSATPQEVKSIFTRTVDTGIKHGTVTVLIDKEGFEVTTYRIDGEYEDNRHPKSVEFTNKLIDDLKRRDFTINAMAYNDKQGLVDEFDGMSDLEKKIIRCVGIPEERFDEDALRILRGVRFSAQLGFEIEERTKKAITNKVTLLKNISAERIQVELTKLITSPNPDKLLEAYELGITNIVLPEFDRCMMTEQKNPHHIYNVGIHQIKSLGNIGPDHILRWTMLLHDIGKPLVKSTDDDGIDHFYNHASIGEDLSRDILKRLKFDNKTIDNVTRLIKYHDYRFEVSEANVRKAMNRVGLDIFEMFMKVQRADITAQNPIYQGPKLEQLALIEKEYNNIITKGECVTIKQLAINGNDLIRLGIPQGEKIGIILNLLLEEVIETPELNNALFLTKRTEELKNNL